MTMVLSAVLGTERLAALKDLATRHGVKDLRVFGSYARGEAREDSDLDLLVDLDYGPGAVDRLLDFCNDAERFLGVKVDVVTERALSPRLHREIFAEARAL